MTQAGWLGTRDDDAYYAEPGASGFPLFDELGLVVLGIDSREASCDLRFGGFGPDVHFSNQALDWTFDRCNLDPVKAAVEYYVDQIIRSEERRAEFCPA